MHPKLNQNCFENQATNWIGQGKPPRACQERPRGPKKSQGEPKGRAKKELRGAKSGPGGSREEPREPNKEPRRSQAGPWGATGAQRDGLEEPRELKGVATHLQGSQLETWSAATSRRLLKYTTHTNKIHNLNKIYP